MNTTDCSLCGKADSFYCNGCLLRCYCSSQHQKNDWPKHKLFCKAQQYQCFICNKRENLLMCHCRLRYYCSREHQLLDSEYHCDVCKIFQFSKVQDDDSEILPFLLNNVESNSIHDTLKVKICVEACALLNKNGNRDNLFLRFIYLIIVSLIRLEFYGEAESYARDALNLCSTLMDPSPLRSIFKILLGDSLIVQCKLLKASLVLRTIVCRDVLNECPGRWLTLGSESQIEEAFQIDGAEKANYFKCKGYIAEMQENYIDAVDFFQKSLQFTQIENGENHPSVIDACENIGLLINRHLHKPEQAEIYFRKALTTAKIVLGDKHPKVGAILCKISLVVLEQGKFYESWKLLDESSIISVDYKEIICQIRSLCAFKASKKFGS